MRFIQYKPLDGATASTDLYSDPIDVSSVVAIGLQTHIVSGTCKGKSYIQVSLDPINSTPTNFVTVGTGADLTGSATTAYDYNNISANWVRIYWSHSSSTGTITSHVKTIGY